MFTVFISASTFYFYKSFFYVIVIDYHLSNCIINEGSPLSFEIMLFAKQLHAAAAALGAVCPA